MREEIAFRRKPPHVVAHRGASGHAPEATLAAYRLAIRMGVDFIELDVQMTRDGEIIVIHDSRVDRTTNGSGLVRELTLAEIRALDAGTWFNNQYPDKARPEFAGQQVPTVQEIIDLAGRAKVGLYVEIKNPQQYPPEFEQEVVTAIQRNHFQQRVMLLSFDTFSLAKVKALDPSIPTALLSSGDQPDPVATAQSVHAGELALCHEILTHEIAIRARQKGLTLAAWTVDEKYGYQRLIGLEVDRIITNYPDRLLRLLGRGAVEKPKSQKGM